MYRRFFSLWSSAIVFLVKATPSFVSNFWTVQPQAKSLLVSFSFYSARGNFPFPCSQARSEVLARRVEQLEEEANVEREEKVWGSPVYSLCYRSVLVVLAMLVVLLFGTQHPCTRC